MGFPTETGRLLDRGRHGGREAVGQEATMVTDIRRTAGDEAKTEGSAELVAVIYETKQVDTKRELIESQRFRDFLPTKNGCMVFGLVGHDNIK